MTHEVQVSIPYFNALPRDCATNVLHFNRFGGAPIESNFVDLVDVLTVFYSTIYNQTGFGGAAPYANPDGTRYKIYDLDDVTPRAPVYETVEPFGYDATSECTMPPETAVCCSFSGVGLSGTPLASQRGRMYLGILGDGVVSLGTSGQFPTVGEAFRNFVNSAAQALVGNASTAGWIWVVLSRKLSTTYPVVKGYCDDAFDTQRRRGQDTTIRSTWP